MAGGANNFSPQQNWQSIGGNGFYGYNNQGAQAYLLHVMRWMPAVLVLAVFHLQNILTAI
jgi:hypothetical protein